MPAPRASQDAVSQDSDHVPPNRRVVQDIVSASTNASPIGLDTVRIGVEQFKVEPSAEFTIHGTARHSTGETSDVPLWRRPNGDPVIGTRAARNTDLAQITVRSYDYMSVQSSLPKILYGDNVCPVSAPNEVEQALRELETHLRENGIRCRLTHCPVHRVDIFRNVRTDAPIGDFKESLRELEAPYLSARDNGHEGMKWDSNQGGSSEREITLYDKSKEAGLETPNVQRLEYRLQSRRVVEAQVSDLSTTDLCEDLNLVRSAFREIVEELFPQPPQHLRENGAEDASNPGVSSPGQNDDGDESGLQITSSDIRPVLEAIRSEKGSNCHSLSLTAWTLLWAIYPQPEQLWDAFKRAAASEAGPTGGKYTVRDKERKTRDYAHLLDEDLKTEDQRLAQLREKLLA